MELNIKLYHELILLIYFTGKCREYNGYLFGAAWYWKKKSEKVRGRDKNESKFIVI